MSEELSHYSNPKWCVLVCDDSEMAHGVRVIGSFRSKEKASEVADRINRKIEIHSPAMGWPSHDGEPRAWVQEMRTKVTQIYKALGIQSLRDHGHPSTGARRSHHEALLGAFFGGAP